MLVTLPIPKHTYLSIRPSPLAAIIHVLPPFCAPARMCYLSGFPSKPKHSALHYSPPPPPRLDGRPARSNVHVRLTHQRLRLVVAPLVAREAQTVGGQRSWGERQRPPPADRGAEDLLEVGPDADVVGGVKWAERYAAIRRHEEGGDCESAEEEERDDVEEQRALSSWWRRPGAAPASRPAPSPAAGRAAPATRPRRVRSRGGRAAPNMQPPRTRTGALTRIGREGSIWGEKGKGAFCKR
eukprot:scaffold21903_cov116-Isochrysis_galbana.AAC.3